MISNCKTVFHAMSKISTMIQMSKNFSCKFLIWILVNKASGMSNELYYKFKDTLEELDNLMNDTIHPNDMMKLDENLAQCNRIKVNVSSCEQN